MSGNKRPVSDDATEQQGKVARADDSDDEPEIVEVRADDSDDEPEIVEVRAAPAILEVRASEVAFLRVQMGKPEVRAPVPEVQQVWPRSLMEHCFFCLDPHSYLCKLQSFECTTPDCAIRVRGVCVECAPRVETGVSQCPICRGPSRVLNPEAVAEAVAAAAEAASAAAAAELAGRA